MLLAGACMVVALDLVQHTRDLEIVVNALVGRNLGPVVPCSRGRIRVGAIAATVFELIAGVYNSSKPVPDGPLTIS